MPLGLGARVLMGSGVFPSGPGVGVTLGTGAGVTVQDGTWQHGSLGSVVNLQPGLRL